jgi:hypothetical protein
MLPRMTNASHPAEIMISPLKSEPITLHFRSKEAKP